MSVNQNASNTGASSGNLVDDILNGAYDDNNLAHNPAADSLLDEVDHDADDLDLLA